MERDTVTGLLFLILLLIVGRLALVYVRPERDCRWCGGDGKSRLFSGRCRRCRGDGRVWRFGARLVRKAHLAAVRAWQERGDGQ